MCLSSIRWTLSGLKRIHTSLPMVSLPCKAWSWLMAAVNGIPQSTTANASYHVSAHT